MKLSKLACLPFLGADPLVPSFSTDHARLPGDALLYIEIKEKQDI